MITSTNPIFVQLVNQEAQERKQRDQEKAARNYERSLDGMHQALENVFGVQAAQQIKEQGYTATIEGERFWRFNRFAFQPYQWGACGDSESKWFRFAVMETSNPDETKRLTSVRACDDMKDVYDALQLAEQNRVDQEAKAVQLTIGKAINPGVMRLHGVIKRIEDNEARPFDTLILALLKFNSEMTYSDYNADDSDDE